MLTCPECGKDYTTSGEQQPRILIGCGHTFCQQCLDSSQVDGQPLQCPQCSIASPEPHVPNITIMWYVDAQSAQPPPVVHHVPAPQKALCQNCRNNIATLICFQCLPAGYRFCDECSESEHSRPFGPLKEHNPKPVQSVRISTPVPTCQTHTGKPCLFFSFKVNKFACEECKTECTDFVGDRYIPIDDAVAYIRDEVPTLIQLIRERVDTISQTRAELEQLLGRVDQEKAHATDRVRVEFNQFEMALKKRVTEVVGKIESEAHFQRKSLIEQQERLELAQGNADTAVVRANWLLQMMDYNSLQQAESIIKSMKDQITDQNFPLYQFPVTKGDIPVHISPDFLTEIQSLGVIGGGGVPARLQCEVENGLLRVTWEQTDTEVREHEIRYEPVEEEDSEPSAIVSSIYNEYMQDFPCSINVPGNVCEKRVNNIMPGKKYCFRVRARNTAGWGVWSSPVLGMLSNFPLEIGYTGEMVEIKIPSSGLYAITVRGAKAADGDTRKGGHGGIIEAKFYLNKYDKLIVLCGGMSKKIGSSSGGAGGTFVALNRTIASNILIVSGGGGGTRGHDNDDLNGKDANIESDSGFDGCGAQWASGGAGGGAGGDAIFTGPSWGHGGAGLHEASSTAESFLRGGEPISSDGGGGFGGGGAVGHFGGGGGGGYSGGGGGRGGGGGGSYIRKDGLDQKRLLGNDGHGSVTIVHVDAEQ